EPNNDTDIWVLDLASGANGLRPATRVTRVAGDETRPTWAPDSARIAYGRGTGVWVSTTSATSATSTTGATRAGILASRHFGVPSWSPDSQWLAIATYSATNAGYNGNPNRNDSDPPTVLASANQYQLWRVLAPRTVDEGASTVALTATD